MDSDEETVIILDSDSDSPQEEYRYITTRCLETGKLFKKRFKINNTINYFARII